MQGQNQQRAKEDERNDDLSQSIQKSSQSRGSAQKLSLLKGKKVVKRGGIARQGTKE